MNHNLRDQLIVSVALPLRRTPVFTGSALPLRLTGIPAKIEGCTVAAVTVSVTNADGATATAPAVRQDDASWCVRFGPSCFENFGYVECGFRVTATVLDGELQRECVLGVGDVDVIKASPNAQPGIPTKSFQEKGGDIYLKSTIVDNVQHFKRIALEFNERVGWAFSDPYGDFILADGQFTPAE